ncbi:centromere protein J isoform X2 [Rana temporaria]|uniref:centromere protein J isoform X2 n=1 Tax=Rana temporaria TaxID=8407 RepID=UPI001AAD0564|nr:centromere protein J isoform X2 [Rana temporaria]
MPEMISSPEFGSEPNFMTQYMPTIARSGVIVNASFPNLEQDGGLPRRPSSALSGLRVPTPFAGSSSLPCEDSPKQRDGDYKQPELRTDTRGHMSVYKDLVYEREGIRSRPQSRTMFREDEVLREELDDPLLRKLEQLKELQQQKQEQLKHRQMEQLQKLMEEQKMLIHMSHQPVYSDDQQKLQSGHVGGSVSQKNLFRLMSPISGNIPRDYFYKNLELSRSSSRPSSVLAQECSPEKSKTLEDLLKEEVEEDYSSDEGDTGESAHDDSSLKEPLKKNHIEAEERPIVSSIKERETSFEEFLEEQLRLEERRLQQTEPKESPEGQANSKPVVKRQFLRRGEGLARFKGGNKKLPKTQEIKTTSQKLSETAVPPKAEKVQVHRKIALSTKEQGAESNLGATKTTNQNVKEKNESVNKKMSKNNSAKNRAGLSQGQQDNKSTSSGRSSVTLERLVSSETDKENADNSKTFEPPRRQGYKVKEAGTKNNFQQISDLHKGSANPVEFSFEISFQKRKAQWQNEKQKENYDLNEFLLLEQAADDISFSSNSSFVQKLLDQDYVIDNGQRRLSSTPVKSVERHQEKGFSNARSGNGGRLNQKFQEPGSVLKNIYSTSTAGFGEQTLKKSNEITKGPEVEIKISSKDSEPATSEGDYASSADEHNNSGLSENEDLESEDSSQEYDPKTVEPKGPSKKLNKETKGRDLDLDLSDGGDQENEDTTLLGNSKASLKDDSSSTSSESEVGFDDERTWDDLGNVPSLKGVYESRFTNKEFIPSEYTSKSPPDIPDKAITRKIASKKGESMKTGTAGTPDPPASELMMKLFPALKPKAKPESQAVSKNVPVQEGPGDFARSQLLKEKLVELETEIERFKMENASLARLHEDKEKTLETLKKEVADFEQQKAKELARIEEYKKEEMKKLQKERKVFEKYASAARAMPDKKEREEIQNLKQQIKELQDELRKKETKWSTSHVRLRNQIETLTKENTELREEIKFMEKVRLESWKKAEAGESKKKSDGPGPLLRRSESVSPLHMLKQRRTSVPVPELEKNTKVHRSQSPIKGLSSRSFRQMSIGESSISEPTRVKIPEPAASTTISQGSDKLLPTEMKSESFPVKESDDVQGEVSYPDGKVERILKNGCHVILFTNGTQKEVSADGKSTTVTFFNGDVKKVMADQRVIYYYADAQTTHTTYPDGIEILQFSNGQIEKHFPDGKKEITFPDQTIKNLYPDGKEESIFPDGTIITSQIDGNKIIEFDNGQRELHTPQFKRREYPDGTIKTVYTNGQQETKYASGRVRVKDKDGNVIMDTKM